jgi:phosphoribosyl-ATP pyrophosphohydrolase
MFLDEQKTHAIMRYSSDSTSKKKVDSRTSKTTKNGKKKIAKAEAKESNELIMKLIESNGPFG